MVSSEAMQDLALSLGARRAGTVEVAQISFQPSFRTLCAQNACGMYGRNWMCPPHVGEVEELIARARRFRHILVYQTVTALEDSYDIEGMLAAGEAMNRLTLRLRERLDQLEAGARLHLGAGGCRMCSRCAKLEGRPCPFPDRALASLEAYGMDVTALAALTGMPYINGPNTVTYFGAVLWEEQK